MGIPSNQGQWCFADHNEKVQHSAEESHIEAAWHVLAIPGGQLMIRVQKTQQPESIH